MLPLLALLMLLLYPFSLNHFFSPQHPDPLFIFAHSSPQHLLVNMLSLFLLWLISKKVRANEIKLVLVFFISSFASLFISLLFNLPVLGSSVGIYGMLGFILPELSPLAPPWLSYALFFLVIIFSPSIPWEKLFHVFGITFGVVLRYFYDYRNMETIKKLVKEGLDQYAIIGTAYFPSFYSLEYRR